MSEVLLVSHAPSPHTRQMTEAVLRGARHPDINGVEIRWLPPLEAQAQDVLACQAIILGTTENFGYMSGAMKDFFDRIYYPCLDHTDALPWALFVRAGNDGSGTRSGIERIVSGLNWKAVQAPLMCVGDWREEFIDDCEELGMTLAAGLEAGIF